MVDKKVSDENLGAAISDVDSFRAVQGVSSIRLTFALVKTWVRGWIAKGDVGLGNVDNTADVTKNAAAVTLTNKIIDLLANTLTYLPVGVGALLRNLYLKITSQLDLRDFCVGDGIVIAGGTVTIVIGTPNLAVVGASFTAANAVGKTICVPGAAAAGGILTTTILAFVDATHVTLNTNAVTGVAGVVCNVVYGTDDFNGITNAITQARNFGKTIFVAEGNFLHSGVNNWAWNRLHVVSLTEDCHFYHIGSGIANSFNGFGNLGGQGCIGSVFGGPGRIFLHGHPAGGTTEVVHIDNWHFGYMKIAPRDGAKCILGVDTGIVGASAVDSTFDIRISSNIDGAFLQQPGRAIDWAKPVGCVFEKIIVESCGAGGLRAVVFTGAISNNFRGGTVESNAAGGISFDSTSARNTFQNIDVETNGTGTDWSLLGNYNILQNCNGAGTASGNSFGGTNTILEGGKYQSINNSDDTLYSINTEFLVGVTDTGGHTTFLNNIGGFISNKSNSATSIGNANINTANNVALRINSILLNDVSNSASSIVALETKNIAWTPTDQSGAALVFTAVNCRYTRIGNMVYAYGTFTFPSTANAATVQIGGLPFPVPNASYAQVVNAIKDTVGVNGCVSETVIATSNFKIFKNGTATYAINSDFTTGVIEVNIVYPVA